MKWLIQSSNLRYDNTLKLVEEVKEKGLYFSDIPLLPFAEQVPLPLGLPEEDFILYGSTRLVELAQYDDQLKKGIFFNGNFNTQVWLANRSDMLNTDTRIINLDANQDKINDIELSCDTFIRPMYDLKPFNGQILLKENGLRDFYKNTIVDSDKIYGLAVLSPAVNIEKEWRFFIVDRKIVAWSQYRSNNKLEVTRSIDLHTLKVAREKSLQWLPHEHCVMDLALTGGDYKVIEFNCINASGFYDCDVTSIVDAFEFVTKDLDSLKHSMQRFLRADT